MDESGNGRGALHRIGEPDVERKLRRFSAGSNKKKKRRGRDVAFAGQAESMLVREAGYIDEAQRSTEPRDKKHSENKSRVADAVDDEGLVRCVTGRLALEVETDEQIRTQADALPADEHEHIIVGEDQREHGKHE